MKVNPTGAGAAINTASKKIRKKKGQGLAERESKPGISMHFLKRTLFSAEGQAKNVSIGKAHLFNSTCVSSPSFEAETVQAV